MPISPDEQKKIQELRHLVSDYITPYYDTDYNLLRWLKGHDNDLNIIVPKLINHLKLRRSDWQLDALAEKPRDHVVHKHWKSGLTGQAGVTPNVIVNIEQSGANDYWGMLRTHPINEILRARVHDLESMLRAVMELEKETGEQCSVIYVMDLTGLAFDKKTMALLSGGLASISAFMQEHYVEMVHSFVLVNVPAFISAVWSIAKPLLPEKTRNKVNILGGSWRQDILQVANASVLPSYWNDKGKDGPFTADVQKGVPFPEENYYKDGVSAGAKTLSVPAGKEGWIDIAAEKGQIVSWEVHASGHFAFCVYILENGEEDNFQSCERAYPLFSKVPGPTMVPCKDSLTSPVTGTLRFWFGNQHAWFHTLKLTHLIEASK